MRVNGTLDIPGVANGLAVTGNLDAAGNGDLTLTVTSLSIRGFTITNAIFTAAKNGANLSFGAVGTLSFLGASLTVQQGTLTISPTTIAGNLTLTGVAASGLDFGGAKLKGALTIAFSGTAASVAVSGTLDIPGVANGLSVTGNLDAAGNGNLTLSATSLSIRGFTITNATFTATKNATTLSFTAAGKLSFLGTSLTLQQGTLTISPTSIDGTLAVSGNVSLGGFVLKGGVSLQFSGTSGSMQINSLIDVPGVVTNLAISGSLNSSFVGFATASIPAGTRLGGSTSAFTFGGTFTLSRASSGTVTFTATNVALAWSGVGSLTVPTFSIASNGVIDVDLTNNTFTVGTFTMTFGGLHLHADAGALAVKLHVGATTLTLAGVTSTTGASSRTYTVPAFDIDTTGNFSEELNTTDIDFLGFDLDATLVFARVGGVFEFEVQAVGSTPAHVNVPGFGAIDIDNFVIATGGTFDAALHADRLGPDGLSIRDAAIHLRKTGASLSTFSLHVTGGKLFLPVGNPVSLGAFDLNGSGNISPPIPVSVPSLNLGPLFRTTGSATLLFGVNSGTISADLSGSETIATIGGSMTLTNLHIDSTPAFTGTVTGTLDLLGFTLAQGTFAVTQSGTVARFSIPSNHALGVGLGPVTGSVSGLVQGDGRFQFDGTATVDLRVLGIGPVGSTTVHMNNTGLTGTFTGSICIVVGCATFASLTVNSAGHVKGSILGVAFDFKVFDAAVVPPDTTPPQIAPISDITVTAALGVSNGIAVNYPLPVATDDTDTSPTVTCSPASGSVFVAGNTTVTCTAKDNVNNTSTRSFVMHVINDPTLVLSLPSGTIGTVVGITGTGFAPSSGVTATLFSRAVRLGTTTADSTGTVHWKFVVPHGVPPGAHHVQLAGIQPDGDPHLTVYDFTILGGGHAGGEVDHEGRPTASFHDGSGVGSIPFTGANTDRTGPFGLALLLLGLVCVLAARRRIRV